MKTKNKDVRIYLQPKHFRRGSPTLLFAAKRFWGNSKKPHFELGVFHELHRGLMKRIPLQGRGDEYDACHCMTISEELFNALKKEAQKNQKKYKIK